MPLDISIIQKQITRFVMEFELIVMESPIKTHSDYS